MCNKNECELFSSLYGLHLADTLKQRIFHNPDQSAHSSSVNSLEHSGD